MTNAFLLTRQWRDTREGVVLDLWWATEQGSCWTQITGQEVVFFVERKYAPELPALFSRLRAWRMAEVELKNFHNQPIVALYFKQHRSARDAQDLLRQQQIVFWESDIRPPERYLMERFITAAAQLDIRDITQQPLRNPRLAPVEDVLWRPQLRLLSLDIETSMDAQQLYSIAIWCDAAKTVFMIGDGEFTATPESKHSVIFCRDDKECLQQFFAAVAALDPDILIGWNLVQFDLLVLENICQKLALTLNLGRAQQAIHWRHEDASEGGRSYVVIPGRVALDGIELLKAANYRYESYSLQNIVGTLLGESKLIGGNQRGDDITRLFNTDKLALAQYNLCDCELVWKIFQQQELLAFAMERSQLTGLLLDRIGGSVAAFEYLYLPRLHRRGYVAPNLGELESDVISPGGYVMNSRPGIYDNVLVLDFKSLYPSIMRSFLIDPCAFWLAQHECMGDEKIVPGFNGAFFAREGHILPQVIEQLSSARDRAKQHKNAPLSHAIKIIMNSFYGVLGSTGCRFFDPRVCSSITLRGHEIIQRSREWIEQQGYAVIYGDTDSLFVWLENNCAGHAPKNAAQCDAIGKRLAKELNLWWAQTLQHEFAIKSALEIQYETHYLRFLMPTIRGSELGTKKRYAGLVEVNGVREMVFKGLENVRTDWTQLAKDFQAELYRKIFNGEDYLDFVRITNDEVIAGKRDLQLIYRKRLRRHLHEYQKNVPPHVQAARKFALLTGEALRRGDWISYVITTNGPEPVGSYEVDLALLQSPIDYQHYVDKQLSPVADSILHFLDESLTQLVDQQLPLFG
uniref:DNA polymerase II n=1 Tax=Cellvibrio fontiphilus TaxID=1815559 RepID=UPI002B4C0AD3|nr:DNA polymerase II [Cellvibrio fontiphilus]